MVKHMICTNKLDYDATVMFLIKY